MTVSSHLFRAYRAIGFVSDATPFHVVKLGTENFVTVAVGKSFLVYNCDKLRLMLASSALPRRIRALTSASGSLTYAACGTDIFVYRRATRVFRLCGHENDVTHLLAFGDAFVSVGEDRTMRTWAVCEALNELSDKEFHIENCTTLECVQHIMLSCDDTVTCIMHPLAYLNKVVMGYASGRVDIYNIESGKCVYTLKNIFTHNQIISGVTCIEQSPLIDIVAIGLSDGRVLVHNLRTDEHITFFTHSDAGPITAVSFRTGSSDSDCPSQLVSTASNGSIAVWDLERRSLHSQVNTAHDGVIVSAKFLFGEPLLLTSGDDNALRMWIFDTENTAAPLKLLRQRSGHSAPPTLVRFYDERTILSTGSIDRTLRSFSLLRDEQNVAWSQGKGSVKSLDLAAPATGLAFGAALNERNAFANVVTCHTHDAIVRTWQFARKAIASHRLGEATRHGALSNDVVATCVAVSACGHFSLVGTSIGAVHVYNLQSGIHRGTFVHDLEGSVSNAHNGVVSSVHVAPLNSCVITCGIDALIHFWAFKKRLHIASLSLGSSCACASLCVVNNLLAVSCDDLVTRVVDTDRHRVVRRLRGHHNRITDTCFSATGRELVTSSMDASVRVFDVVSGALIDWLAFAKPVTSVAFSPRNDMLATTHVNSVAIFLWANRAYFSNVYLHAVPNEPVDMMLTPRLNESNNDIDENDTSTDEDTTIDSSRDDIDMFSSVGFQPITADMLTLSSLPTSQWKTLASLDIIKERNRPTAAPEKPENAPFFLPTLSGLEPQLDTKNNDQNESLCDDNSRIKNIDDTLTPLAQCLHNDTHTHNFAETRELLMNASASGVDGMIRGLGFHPDREVIELSNMLDYFLTELASKRNFEVVQAHLNLFLKVHASVLLSSMEAFNDDDEDKEKFSIRIRKLHQLQQTSWSGIETEFQSSLCMLGVFNGIQL